MKKHFILFSTFAALLLSATLLTACGENVQELADNGNNVETVTETTVGENCTLFSTGDDGTRTSLGTDRKFYWSEGDQIYVNIGGTNYKKTTSSTLSSDSRTADFVLEGVSLTVPKCSVVYIGNGMANTQETVTANELKVKIEKTQTQAAWGDSTHIGRSGDCGVAEAKKVGGKYTFDLKHKASYLIFQPYKDPQITANWKLLKIEIITDGTTKVAGEYPFGTGELDVAHATATSDTVELNCNSTIDVTEDIYLDPESYEEYDYSLYEITGGFSLGASSSAANSCFAVIQPGTHKLTIRYTILPEVSFNYVKPGSMIFSYPIAAPNPPYFYIDKEIAVRDYAPNVVTPIKHKLDVWVWPYPHWYQWGASRYTGSLAARDYSNVAYPAQLSMTSPVNWNGLPNVNELFNYCIYGDPHYDTTTLWTMDGGKNVFTGGYWLKTRTAIGARFRSDISLNGKDMRTNYFGNWSSDTSFDARSGKPADTTNYFFLPLSGTGVGSQMGCSYMGYGAYWSKSSGTLTGSNVGGVAEAGSGIELSLGYTGELGVIHTYRFYYAVVEPGWFK